MPAGARSSPVPDRVAAAPPHDWFVRATSSGTFGRVLLNARTHHVVVDGPARNGCPGEALTPAELFLGGVAACAVELVEVIAREQGTGPVTVAVETAGTIDRAHEVRDDVTVFRSVHMRFVLSGVGDEDAAALVAAFQAR